MKLKDHPKFPKERNNGKDIYELQWQSGYNSALRELGELEILEELDFVAIKSIISNLICSCSRNIAPELLNNKANLTTDKIMRFGIKKLSMQDAPPKVNGEYKCEHAKNKTIDSQCIWCNMSVLEKIKENYNKLIADSINKGG